MQSLCESGVVWVHYALAILEASAAHSTMASGRLPACAPWEPFCCAAEAGLRSWRMSPLSLGTGGVPFLALRSSKSMAISSRRFCTSFCSRTESSRLTSSLSRCVHAQRVGQAGQTRLDCGVQACDGGTDLGSIARAKQRFPQRLEIRLL